jgi:SagB-type dehydrogenase family enzyme
MISNVYYLSPYCVCYPEPDNETVTLIHSYYGSKFSVSRSLFQIVVGFLGGKVFDDAVPPHVSHLLKDLIAEQVLIDQVQFERLNQDTTFKNRLQPVELAFHRGFNEGGYFPELVPKESPPAAWKEYPEADYVELRIHESFQQKDLVQSLSQRRSTRRYSDRPIELPQLEQFLQLTGKAYALIKHSELGTTSLRNYPSGGGRYPLEIYPAIYNVAGLPSRFYHYHPFRHCLTKLDSPPDHVSLMLTHCKRRLGTPEQWGNPAIVFIITAVFARTCWKYRGTPHHLILKEVGALYQTMYLASDLLNWAACPIGAFPGTAVDEMLGLDSVDESTVGIFLSGNPDSSEDTTFTVKELREHARSPFSSDPAKKSIEFIFSDEQTEIIDLQEIRVECTSDQKPYCWVNRGRRRAFLSAELEAQLRKVLNK